MPEGTDPDTATPRRRADTGKRAVLRRVEEPVLENKGDGHGQPGEGVEVWALFAVVEADNDRAAIEKVAGKPNTIDAKPGHWKAVPLANWKGTAVYERPPEPIVGVSWSEE